MHRCRLFITALAVALALFVLNTTALAQHKIGLVDMEKILTSYGKAKEAQAVLQTNQEEIQKMLVQAKKEIEGAKSDQEKEKLQKEFAGKLMQKNNSFRENFNKKWEAVEDNVLSSIKQVADKEGFSLIMEKQSVIAGGEDITDRVLSKLK